MAPLLPSESSAYSLAFPEEVEDDRLNLKVRTGSAVVYTSSTLITYAGLTIGLGLPTVTIPYIEQTLQDALGANKDWNSYLSNEIFYLNIINRKWNRVELPADAVRPRPRLFHSVTFIDSSIYVFGGLVLKEKKNKFVPVSDLWRFDIRTSTWECLDEGKTTATVARYDHTIKPVCYISPVDHQTHRGLAIAGGRGEVNQELMNIAIYDLKDKRYHNNAETQLTQNELKQADGKSARGARSKLKVTSPSSFVLSGSSNPDNETHIHKNDLLYIFSQEGINDENLKNPFIALPVAPNASGVRLELPTTISKNTSVVPRGLRTPTGGVFGSNIFVSGFSIESGEYQVYLFNRPSLKWTRLSIDSKLKAKDMYLWKSFSWHSHHKILILGSTSFPVDPELVTIQKFDLLVLVGLPITNIFHGFTLTDTPATGNKQQSASYKDTTSFEAYSKYLAPSSKISSIGSVFPSYAVTLGRNAFERFGGSLADFEFITADGDKVNVPLMLLRKRWGRCFDMLLAKAYARAVYRLDNTKDDDVPEEDDVRSSVSSAHQSKKSMKMMMTKVSQHVDRTTPDPPQFRLPFQDKSVPMSPLTSISSGGHLTPSLPTSRKASVVSANASLVTTSTTDLPDGPDLSNLPPQSPPPSDPLPPIETRPTFLKTVGSRDYLRDSPRGSISGASAAPSAHSANPSVPTNSVSGIKLKDLRTPVNQLKKRGTSKSSGPHAPGTFPHDEGSVTESASGLGSVHTEAYEESKNLLEPLLIPRSLYLPFATSTVQAMAEFLFVGKLGDRWLLFPTTTDTFLISKFYELPLLYDLISEALYAILGKKEEGLIKQFGQLMATYEKKVKEIFTGDEELVNKFFEERPHIRESFNEIEGYLNTIDDGFLNLSLLRKLGKSSASSSSSPTNKNSIDVPRRSSSPKARIGKSSLSRELKTGGEIPVDDIENEAEDDEGDDKQIQPIARAAPQETIRFRTDSMSNTQTSPKRLISSNEENIDPITPLTKLNDSSAVDDEDDAEGPLGATQPVVGEDSIGPLDHGGSTKTDSESDSGFAVPEGNFKIAKGDKLVKLKSGDSSSSNKDKTTTTSDSDEMAVGLGLAPNLKQKKKSGKGGNGRPHEENDGDANDDDDDIVLTLEHLASPNSPAPHDNIIQIIYEAAALACDMKLLLRSTNALEMSRLLTQKSDVLLEELDSYGVKWEEEKERILKDENERIQNEQKQINLNRLAQEDKIRRAQLEENQQRLDMEREKRERRLRELAEAEEFEDIQAQLVKGKISQTPVSPMVSTNAVIPLAPSVSPLTFQNRSPSNFKGTGSIKSTEENPLRSFSYASSAAALNSASGAASVKTESSAGSGSGASDVASLTSPNNRGLLKQFSTMNINSRKPSTPVGTFNDQLSDKGDEKKPKLFGLLSRKK